MRMPRTVQLEDRRARTLDNLINVGGGTGILVHIACTEAYETA
jgi:hypothetical protein